MSLFKVCTCWSVQCTDILNNYDSSSLLCTRFGLKENEKDYIAIGSHNGHFSLYYPNYEFNDNNNSNSNILLDYKPTDLLLEINLNSPIISLTAGKFTGSTIKNDNSQNNCNQLAILHPHTLAIYNITIIDGISEHGKQCSLQLLHEYQLNRSAFSLCKGSFGRIKGRDFICVTHLDGTLTFYEQDGISYECLLPGPKTLPSVLAYIPRTDSFVRVNFCWELESFSYQDLSQSSVNLNNKQHEISPNWSICLGEFVLDLCSVQVTNSRTVIMILGEHNLICLTDEGRFQFIIKLDYSPKCIYSFVVGWYWEPNARLITVIVSESSSLLIYEETQLIWAAQLDKIPVAIQRSNIENLPGALVILDENGFLQIGYLGSEPNLFKVPPLNLQELNFEKAHTELLQLENEIKQNIDVTDLEMINSLAEQNLELKFLIIINENNQENLSENLQNNPKILKCTGIVKYICKIPLEQIQIHIETSDGIQCNPSIMTQNNLLINSSDQIEFQFQFQCNDCIFICTNEIHAIISYITKEGIPRVLRKSAYLPLNLLYEKCPPQKDAQHKFTLTINNIKNMKLSAIYSQFFDGDLAHNDEKDIQALGLCLKYKEGHEVVTIVAAKNSNRYRIQSDCLEAIPPILETMINYVKAADNEVNQHPSDETVKIRKTKKSKLVPKKSKIVMAAPVTLPIKEIMQRIDSHHNIQTDIRKQTTLMDMLWNQFKLFQKSLQAKSDNDPVDGLMMLIGKNYDDLIIEGDKLMELRKTEKSIRSNLSCAIALIKHLINCFNLDERTNELIQSILIYPIEDWTEKSWEETLDPALNMLHHYEPLCRNKNSKKNHYDDSEDINSTNTKNNQQPENAAAIHLSAFEIDRFKRHMTSLLDRICRLTTVQVQQSTATTINQKPISPPQQQYSKNTEIRKQFKGNVRGAGAAAVVLSSDDDNEISKIHVNDRTNNVVNNITTARINENNDNTNFKNINNNNKLETLPDKNEDENGSTDDDDDDDAADDGDKMRENDWINNEIPPTDIMMLNTKRNNF